MAFPLETSQPFCVQATLGTGDATQTLRAAIAGVTFVVTSVTMTILVSGAQAIYVGDSSGSKKALSIAASATLHAQFVMQAAFGLELTIGEALVIKPAAAGPSAHVVVEGWIKS